ncbi:HupE/UreJ protein [Paenibacillus cellulosilyticus]|uniref:HupE/UreJ protein n=1 Tax=Paenibacillus cellulosilyticus TaxID=375489 RepID=A0A2V2YZT5_9BACL|nr:HupE/UreJ family protein [Paenibacillus cellulosilyticus]PWW08533.1 HupE/UreJ protein [Paenibacillus cellulosilyticus]QKS48111.1 HupE/UreJ family protein [Paenibacillus cellulosilyticus]
MIKRKIIALLTVTLILLSTMASVASAHSMPSSVVSLDFNDNVVTAELILPLDRLEISFGKTLTDAPAEVLDKYQAELTAYVKQHINPVSPNDERWTVDVTGMSLQLSAEPYDLIVDLSMSPPDGAPSDHFTLNYDVILHEIVTHSVLVSVRSDWNHAVTSDKPVLLGTLRADVTSIEIDRSGGNWWTGFENIVRMGISHIAEGTDHLLFLLVLLLPAPLVAHNKRWKEFGGVRHSILQLLKVVTAFTLGHSLTLIAGALDWIPGTSQLIEVLIAFSILISAVHALRPLFPGREALVAFGFGLIHGMAFASLIGDIGISPWHMVSSIFAFNIGIELMQLTVIAVTMPWLLLLSVTRVFPYVRIVGACIAITASVGWIAERIMSKSNPVAAVVNVSTPYAAWLVVALAVLAIAATLKRTVMTKKHRSKYV